MRNWTVPNSIAAEFVAMAEHIMGKQLKPMQKTALAEGNERVCELCRSTARSRARMATTTGCSWRHNQRAR